MSTYDPSTAAKSRNRAQGRFAEESRSESTTPLGSTSPDVGGLYDAVPSVGDVVRSRDGKELVIVGLAEYGSAGIESGYALEDPETGEFTQTDLREDDWVLVSKAAPAIGEPDPYGGERVSGAAEVGEVVHYYDIANQHRNPQRVISPSTKHPKYGWDSGYTLEDVVTGEHTTSDLRQHGWTRVETPDA